MNTVERAAQLLTEHQFMELGYCGCLGWDIADVPADELDGSYERHVARAFADAGLLADTTCRKCNGTGGTDLGGARCAVCDGTGHTAPAALLVRRAER
jgi:hypothetical protein